MDFPTESDIKSTDALSQALCRQCGMCCDGTLFETAVISADDDIDELKKSGITTINDDGKAFTLPCTSFDRICTIYHSRRAKVCGAYLCKLLRLHKNGVVSFERAQEIISKTKAHGEKTQASFSVVLGETAGASLQRQYQSILEAPPALKPAESNLAKLNYVALRVQLVRYFQPLNK